MRSRLQRDFISASCPTAGRAPLLLASDSSRGRASPANRRRDSDQEPKVVERPAIVYFIDPNAGLEEAYEEGDWGYKPCHRPAQKPAGLAPGSAYLELDQQSQERGQALPPLVSKTSALVQRGATGALGGAGDLRVLSGIATNDRPPESALPREP